MHAWYRLNRFPPTYIQSMGSQGGSVVKNLPAKQETWVWSLGWEDPLEKERATHSSILAWEISWTEAPDGLQSMRLQRVDITEQLNNNLQSTIPWHDKDSLLFTWPILSSSVNSFSQELLSTDFIPSSSNFPLLVGKMWTNHDSTGVQESLDLDHVFENQRREELPGIPHFPDKVCLTWILQGGNHSPNSEWGLGAQATKGRDRTEHCISRHPWPLKRQVLPPSEMGWGG